MVTPEKATIKVRRTRPAPSRRGAPPLSMEVSHVSALLSIRAAPDLHDLVARVRGTAQLRAEKT